MLKVINTGASAATFGASQRNKRDTRDRTQHVDWRLRDLLGIDQMARSIIRHSPPDVPVGLANARLNQKLRNVSDLGAELSGAIRKQRIISKQTAVFLHRRPAARSVYDDSIGAALK